MPIIPNNTLSSIVNLVNRANSDSVVQPPLSQAAFTLDSSGVAGFFGGESAVRAMGTVYLIPQRRWFGWYNAPGAYEVAKRYSGLAKSHIFNALFPGDDTDPARILMVDGQVGPEYTSLYFPTRQAPLSIGHLGSLIARKVSQMPVKVLEGGTKPSVDARVTFVKLRRVPGVLDELALFPSSSIVFTVLTILISVGGCIACALVADWFCFASIALGIIANGVACSVIGSGKLYLKNNPPSQAGSPGDILLRSDTNIIILFGDEGMARPFTHGRFVLRFEGTTLEKRGDTKAETSKVNLFRIPLGFCSWILQECLTVDVSVILLLFQFLAQLLLIPQGTLFGQLMFIGTLVPSWMYHSYLSTLGLDLQTRALFNRLSIQENDDIYQYQLNTWTQAAVFACLVFRSNHPPTWLSNTTNGDAQRPEGAREEATKKAAEAEKKTLEEKKNKADAEAEAKRQAQADAEKVATDAKNAAEDAENDAKLAGMDEGVAKAEAQEAEAEAEAEEKNAAAEAHVVQGKKDKAANKKTEVARKAVKATTKAAEAMRKAHAARKAEDAVKAAADAAKEAAEVAKEAASAVNTEELNRATEKEEEKRKKEENDRTAQQKEKEDNALQSLLEALLPGQTDVWRAFKESLVRKLSAADSNSAWAYMESDGAFGFSNQDTFASVQGGSLRRVADRKDLEQLHMHQKDAESAFKAWRELALKF